MSEELLRDMVREILRDLVPVEATRAGEGAGDGPPRELVVSTQRDLDDLVRRLVAAIDDPGRRRDWAQVRVVLGAATTPGRATPSEAPEGGSAAAPPNRPASGPVGGPVGGPVSGLATGPVTERMIDAAARGDRVVVVSARAVVTPLAKDRARQLGVEIRREN